MSPTEVDSFDSVLRLEVNELVAARFPAQRSLNDDLVAAALAAAGDPSAIHFAPSAAGEIAIAVVSRIEEWDIELDPAPAARRLADLSTGELLRRLIGSRRA